MFGLFHTIRARMFLFPLITAVGLLAFAVVILPHTRTLLLTNHQTQLRSVVEVASDVLKAYYADMQSGRLTQDQAQKQAKDVLRGLRFADNEYFFVYQTDGVNVVLPPRPDAEGTDKIYKELIDADGVHVVQTVIDAARGGGGFLTIRFPRPGDTAPVPKLLYATLFGPWQWVLGSGLYIDDVDAEFLPIMIGIIILTLIILVVSVGSAALLGWRLGDAIAGLVAIMRRMAGGDATVTIPATDRTDEIGDMARAVTVFKENMLEAQRLTEQGRQHQETRQRRAERIEGCIREFDGAVAMVVQQVSAAASQLHADAQSLSATADRTSQQATTVACSAEQASANVQTVASATVELSASVGEIRRQIQESSQIASTAVNAANRTNTTIAGLSEAAQKIGDVVQLINGIASQTNLLALNATIEAARAGEAGKGFAVVAGEVKNLANQTARATEDIQAQVSQMQAVTGSAVEAIRDIANTIRRMSDITATIAATVAEQGAATDEIARTVSRATTDTTEVSTTITGVSKAAGETGHLATQTLKAAQELTQQAEHLRVVVAGFIGQVRTG